MDVLFLFLAGILGGFFAGLLGIGGGIIYIAILPYALRNFGLSNEILVGAVIANSILATFFAALLSLYRQHVHKNLYIRESLSIGIPGAVILILAFSIVVEQGMYRFVYFNIFIIAILLFMLARHFFKLRKEKLQERKPNQLLYSSIGASGGLLSAFSGLGGGAIVVPLLVSIIRMDIKKATSISMGFILCASFALSIYNLAFSKLNIENSFGGVIILPVIGPLILGVVISAPFGVIASKKVSSATLTVLFILFVLMVMITRILDLI
ncbi:sulfite exporter TauE/SafE family protein [Hyphobacterium sp. CCMP332]|nr:sulfite exporter TauE/SafE family protein [Hyphobacterium sp. CCMP332]